MSKRSPSYCDDDYVRAVVSASIERSRKRLAEARAICRPKPVALKRGWERHPAKPIQERRS